MALSAKVKTTAILMSSFLILWSAIIVDAFILSPSLLSLSSIYSLNGCNFQLPSCQRQQQQQQRQRQQCTNIPAVTILHSTKTDDQTEKPGQFSKTNLNEIRGNRYGSSNNSTILSPSEAASAVNVEPPLEVPKKTWQRAWRIHKRLLPILHLTDRKETRLEDSSLNVACLWWKALAANNKTSPVYDNSLSYDLLPTLTRRLISSKILRFYPRLHHANVEIRTAFLDQTLSSIIQQQQKGKNRKIRLNCMGSGYDPRSIKFLERHLVTECWEFDLPNVVLAKQRLYQSKRFQKRRPWLLTTKDDNGQTVMDRLHFVPADLNVIEDVETKLDGILQHDNSNNQEGSNSNDDCEWYNIFIFEGVMIYLNETIPSKLLAACSQVLKRNNAQGSLCFADRLENIPGGDYDLAVAELERNGWNLVKWLPKPGLARHMGFAVPLGDENKK